MGLRIFRTANSCFEMKGEYSYDNNGEWGWAPTNGIKYPCGTWTRIALPGVGGPKVLSAKTKAAAPQMLSQHYDDSGLTTPAPPDTRKYYVAAAVAVVLLLIWYKL